MSSSSAIMRSPSPIKESARFTRKPSPSSFLSDSGNRRSSSIASPSLLPGLPDTFIEIAVVGMDEGPTIVHVYMHLGWDSYYYKTCIRTLREQLANHPEHEGNISKYGDWIKKHPLLPTEEPWQPKRWMYVHLMTGATRKTTLAIRDDNMYLIGFSNGSGKWYEFGAKNGQEHFLTGSTFLGCDFEYGPLLAGKGNEANRCLGGVKLGLRCAQEAACHLSSYNQGADATVGTETKKHLLCLIIMISEGARMFPHYHRVMDGWSTDIFLDPREVKLVNQWTSISKAMITAEYSKTLTDLRIEDLTSACGVVRLLKKSSQLQLKDAPKKQQPPSSKHGQDKGHQRRGHGDSKGGREDRHASKESKDKKPPKSKRGTPQQQDEEEVPLTSREQGPRQQEVEEQEQDGVLREEEEQDEQEQEEEYGDEDGDDNHNDNDNDDDDDDDGQLLMEVFSVDVNSGLVSNIAVFDGKRGQIIYNHDGQGDATTGSEEPNLQLTGPYRAISADGRVAIRVTSSIPATDASGQSSTVQWATLWDGYVDKPVHDQLSKEIIAPVTSSKAVVTYMVLSNAIEATVQVQLKLDTFTTDSVRINNGQITAKIKQFSGESVLFRHHHNKEVELFPSSDGLTIPIPLARSVVAVPLYSLLAVNVKLHVALPPYSEDMVIYGKKIDFYPRKISDDVEGPGVLVQVTITSEDIQHPLEQSNTTPVAAPSTSTPLQPTSSVPDNPPSILNTTTGKDPRPSSVNEGMLINTAEDGPKSEGLSPMPLDRSTVTQNYQEGAKASIEIQEAPDTAIDTTAPTTPAPVVSYIPKATTRTEWKGDLLVEVALVKCVLEGALTKAKSTIAKETKLQQRALRDLTFIIGELQNMKSSLDVVNEESVKNSLVKSWVMQIEELAYYVDGRMELILEMDKESGRLRRRLFRHLSEMVPTVARRLFPHLSEMVPTVPRRLRCMSRTTLRLKDGIAEIKLLKGMIEDVSRRNAPNSLFRVVSSSKTDGVQQQQTVRTVTVVNGAPELYMLLEGSDATTTQQGDLTQLLTKRDDDLQVISLCTRGDFGSISVIRKSYSDPQVCHNFGCRAWVKLTQPFNPQEFVRCLMAQFYTNNCQEEGLITGVEVLRKMQVLMKMEDKATHVMYDGLLEELARKVSNKRYLVVLEDLSTMPEWDAIRTFLPDRKNGSTIIVSSQKFEVASLCVGQPHQVFDLMQLPTKHAVHAFLKGRRTGDRYEGGLPVSSTDKSLRPEKDAASDWMQKYSLVGRESEMGELGKYLAEARSNSSPVVMSVWGMPGVGKSALVRRLFRNEMLDRRLFDKYIWVDVSHPFSLRDFSQSLLKDFYPGRDPIQECQQLLVQYQCLVVIDDLQTKEEWDLIQDALLSTPCKSVIIVITTEASTATYCAHDPEVVYNVKGLEDDAAYDLFTEKCSSLHQNNEVVHHDPAVARELILKCGGLPKVIVAIAVLLSTKTISWMETAKIINDKFMKHLEANPEFHGLEKLFSWMRSSLYTGPDILKPCIFYLPIFPGNYIIRRRRLIRRWIAEGYSKDINERSAEEEGENLFSLLVDLSIVQQVPRSVSTVFNDSKMVLCQVNSFIHEYIISRQMEENHVFVLGGSSTLTTERTGRHLVILESWDRDKDVFQRIDFSRLRSMTVFGKWESFFSLTVFGKSIQVLDLEGVSGLKDEDLLKIVKRLRSLKFLSLRGCSDIHHLPSSLGDLRHLQTLDARYTSIVKLPASITKLQMLQYIRVGTRSSSRLPESISVGARSSSRLPESRRRRGVFGVVVPRGIGKLTAVQTLGVVNVSASGGKAIVKELKKLTQLRKLGVSGINRKNSERFISAISGHVHLESLSVCLEEDNESCLDDVLLPWENLQSLKLYGLGDKLPASGSHLSRLGKVELEMAILRKEDMIFLGSLPQLCILRIKLLHNHELHFYAFVPGEQDGIYKKLKVLQIACSLSNSASKLDVGFGSKTMRKLELLMIDCCSESQFTGLQNLRELKQVLLVASSDAQRLKEQLESQLAEHPNLVKPVVKLEEPPLSS